MAKLLFAALVPLVGALTTSRATAGAGANPVRKVVTLLQKMQKKVEADAEKADDLYSKFMCYCKNSGGDLSASIKAAETKVPELQTSLEAATSRKQQLDADIVSHQKDRSAAKTAVAEATAIRDKEKAAFDKNSADGQQNLAAVKKAAAAVSAGMGNFLQTPAAARLHSLVGKLDMADMDRQTVLSFLSGQEDSTYAPASGEINGILKTMADEMDAAQKDLVAAEADAVKSFESLTASKKKEIATLASSIEDKMTRVAELGVEIATMKNDIEDTAENLEADKKFAADLEKNCADKTGIHEKEKQMRAEEVVALADTIKILNDDDALELFKQTLPGASASLLQVQDSSKDLVAQVKRIVVAARTRSISHRPGLDFVLLALNGKKSGFSGIMKLIDQLVVSLKSEQIDDDDKKEYCGKQLDQTEDKIKGLTISIDNKKTAVAEAAEQVSQLGEEIKALQVGIVALDKALAEATANRKAESAEFKELMTSNTAAKELILFAKNRMNKFYNPKMYKAAPKRQLSEGDQIFVNEGGDIPTVAPGGIANTGIGFVQVASQVQDAPPPPPATAAAYTKKSQESNGVISMMDLLVKDLDKEMTEAEVDEKNGQEEYEQTVADSASKRRGDSKALTDKEAAKGDLSSLVEKLNTEVKGLGKTLMGASKYLATIHGDCDWLLQYYDVRKQARADEIESLGSAKAVLSGADYSLMQKTVSSHRFARA